MKITEEILIENGYTRYIDGMKKDESSNSPYKFSYQKLLKRELDTEVFINLDYWDFKNSDLGNQCPNLNPEWGVHTQLENSEGCSINISRSSANLNINQLEQWLLSISEHIG